MLSLSLQGYHGNALYNANHYETLVSSILIQEMIIFILFLLVKNKNLIF